MLSLSNLNFLSITQTIFFSRSICPYNPWKERELFMYIYLRVSSWSQQQHLWQQQKRSELWVKKLQWKCPPISAHKHRLSNKTTKRELVSAFSYVLNLVSFDCVGCQSSSVHNCVFHFHFEELHFLTNSSDLGNWNSVVEFSRDKNLVINFKWQSWDQLFLSKCPRVVNKYGIIWSVNWHHRTIPGQNDLKEDQPGRDPR